MGPVEQLQLGGSGSSWKLSFYMFPSGKTHQIPKGSASRSYMKHIDLSGTKGGW